MIARWFHVKMRAAERALDQGRIDDALAAARDAELAEHPRGARLLDGLAQALISRARLHRQAGRYDAALSDLAAVAALGRNSAEAQALRQQIEAERGARVEHETDQRQAAQQAADRLRAGRLESGRAVVARITDTRQRAALEHEFDERVGRAGQLLAAAGEALGRDDLLAAIRQWDEARRRYGHTPEADALAVRLVAAGRDVLARWHRAGKLDRLRAAREALHTLVAHDPTFAECERQAELVARAFSQFATDDYPGLRRTLLQLQAAAGTADWLRDALDALTQVTAGQERLMASPLGAFATCPELAPAVAADAAPTMPLRGTPALPADALTLEQPLLALVDAGGSTLLLGGDLVRLGRAGTTNVIDVPLPGDVESHHADILRRGDDYFLVAYGPVTVNGRPVERVLLHENDRIALGTRTRIVFAKPSAMSASAVLLMSHRQRLPEDVAAVVLFRDMCLIGPDAGCHIRTRGVADRAVLFEQNGRLYGRRAGNGAARKDAVALVREQPTEFGEVRVLLKPYGSVGRGARREG